MRYHDVFAAIQADANILRANVRRLTWSLARTIPSAIGRTAQARIEAMKADNEPFRRLPRGEHDRVLRDIEREESTTRQLAAGAARFAVEKVIDDVAQRLAAYVARRRADVSLSFPNALNHVDANGMLTYHLLTETLRPMVAGASAADLRRMYAEAIETGDARGRIIATLIEERVDHGGLAQTEDDLPIVKQLAEHIEGVRDLRVEPHAELNTISEIITEARKAVSRAEIARVHPANVEHDPNAKAAAEREAEAYEAEAAAR